MSKGMLMKSLATKNALRRTKAFPSLEKLTPYFFILPAGLFLIAIMGYPIIFSVFMSFQKYTLETLVSKQAQFVGFLNYQAVLSNPEFLVALKHSLIFTVVSIAFQFTIGLGLAILFSKSFPLSNTMRGLLLSGWQIPSVVVGTIFLWLFNIDYGLVNFILTSLKLTSGTHRLGDSSKYGLNHRHYREHLARDTL